MLNWHSMNAPRDKQLVRGTELDRCIPDGFRSRFSITSVRTITRGEKNPLGGDYWNHNVFYRVRDAEAANDQHFKDGKPAPIFGEFATLDQALAAIEPHRIVYLDSNGKVVAEHEVIG